MKTLAVVALSLLVSAGCLAQTSGARPVPKPIVAKGNISSDGYEHWKFVIYADHYSDSKAKDPVWAELLSFPPTQGISDSQIVTIKLQKGSTCKIDPVGDYAFQVICTYGKPKK